MVSLPPAALRYDAVPPLEAFAEAFAVVPWMHLPPPPAGRKLTALAIGPYALPVANFVLRYPDTGEVLLTDLGRTPPATPQDKRVQIVPSWSTLAPTPRADLIAWALPGDPVPYLPAVAKLLRPGGVIVVAVDTFARGRAVRESLATCCGQVLAYREHAPDAALFLLAASPGRRFGEPARPLPNGLRRLTPPYVRSLFILAKDEHQHLYGGRAA